MFSEKHLICLTDYSAALFEFVDHQTLPFQFFSLNAVSCIYFQNGDLYQDGLKTAKVSFTCFKVVKLRAKNSCPKSRSSSAGEPEHH